MCGNKVICRNSVLCLNFLFILLCSGCFWVSTTGQWVCSPQLIITYRMWGQDLQHSDQITHVIRLRCTFPQGFMKCGHVYLCCITLWNNKKITFYLSDLWLCSHQYYSLSSFTSSLTQPRLLSRSLVLIELDRMGQILHIIHVRYPWTLRTSHLPAYQPWILL